jgi:hypothetical protein
VEAQSIEESKGMDEYKFPAENVQGLQSVAAVMENRA